jgi:tetratricopeptide (TPR) repeat protein
VGSVPVALPCYLALLAECLLAIGDAREALASTDEALKWSERNEEHQWDVPILLSRAGALSALGESRDAESQYATALSVARKRAEKWWELHAAIRLARLWRDQDKRTEALDLLAPIYGWFTEALDTPLLKEAKELLDELAT